MTTSSTNISTFVPIENTKETPKCIYFVYCNTIIGITKAFTNFTHNEILSLISSSLENTFSKMLCNMIPFDTIEYKRINDNIYITLKDRHILNINGEYQIIVSKELLPKNVKFVDNKENYVTDTTYTTYSFMEPLTSIIYKALLHQTHL